MTTITVSSVDALIENYSRLKQENFSDVRCVEYRNERTNARYRVVVDKRAEMVGKLHGLGIRKLWDDCTYHLDKDTVYSPATFVLEGASFKEADTLISTLMRSRLKIRVSMLDIHTNTPRTLPAGMKALDREYQESASQKSHLGKLGDIVESMRGKQFSWGHHWHLGEGVAISVKAFKDNRLFFDSCQLYSFLNDKYPKADLSLFETVTTSFSEYDK